jgi:hypothetical protein
MAATTTPVIAMVLSSLLQTTSKTSMKMVCLEKEWQPSNLSNAEQMF